MGILAPNVQLVAQQEEDEIRSMEEEVASPDQMEDDLYIPPLQTEYTPSYSAPPFVSTTYPSEPPLMPSYT